MRQNTLRAMSLVLHYVCVFHVCFFLSLLTYELEVVVVKEYKKKPISELGERDK